MTYDECVAIIEKSKASGFSTDLKAIPPKSFVGYFIAPAKRDMQLEERIFNECVEGEKSNKDLLFELNMIDEELRPFIVYQISGNRVATVLPPF